MENRPKTQRLVAKTYKLEKRLALELSGGFGEAGADVGNGQLIFDC